MDKLPQIYFLHHSAVCINIKDCLLIFDHCLYRPDGCVEDGAVGDKYIANARRVYVFVSHSHHDHFNSRIFEWASPHVKFLLDDTVPTVSAPKDSVFMRCGSKYEDEYISVQEFGSTDCGGSFFVVCGNTSFFHAGDLNDWHWKDHGDKRYSRIMSGLFKHEIKRIKQSAGTIDYAFFPVDKRMGADFDSGADYFIETLRPRFFIPIHFVSFEDTLAYKNKMRNSGTNVLEIQKNGQRLV
ncbi:MAG: hypothetical protein WDA65_07270 [Christensenellales bacterium]